MVIIAQKKTKKTWLLHFYYNKTMVNFRKGTLKFSTVWNAIL